MHNVRSILLDRLGGRAKLSQLLDELLAWVESSFAANDNKGSSAYQNILGHWSSPYPETSGYLIPTLLKARRHSNNDHYVDLALEQVSYFEDLSNVSGAISCPRNGGRALFFDNAQILLGLNSLYNVRQDTRIKMMCENIYLWLISCIDNEGKVDNGNFKKDYTPSYYARAVWAIIKYEKDHAKQHSDGSLALLNYCYSLMNENYSFQDWSFDGNASGLSHTIAYTMRGLWESSILLERKDISQSIISSVSWMHNVLIPNKDYNLYGSFDTRWSADTSFVCSAGSSQLALLSLIIYKHTGRQDVLKNLDKIIVPVLNSSTRLLLRKHRAIPSSIPVWQKYQRFRFTNWTQKFVIDFILELLMLQD